MIRDIVKGPVEILFILKPNKIECKIWKTHLANVSNIFDN